MKEQDLLTAPTRSPEETARQFYKNWREGLVLPLLIGLLIFGTIAIVPAIQASGSLLVNGVFIVIYVVAILVTVAKFSYNVRSAVILLGIYALGLSELITHGILGDSLFFFLGLGVFATMMVSIRFGIGAIVLNIITFIVFGVLIQSSTIELFNPDAAPASIGDWVSASAALAMVGAAFILGFQRLEKEFIEAQIKIDSSLKNLQEEHSLMEQKVQERTSQLQKVNEIGRAITSILDPDELFPQTAQLMENDFQCYYTAFYLLDPGGKWAVLRYANGDTGKALLNNRHRIDVEGKSTIAKSIRTQSSQMVSETSQIRIDNPLLPYTRSQMVLPLLVGETLLGALDLHSTKENIFLPQDVDAYQNMANGIAIVMENSRLYQEAQQSLTEMRSVQRQYLRDAWRTATSDRDHGYETGDSETSYANKIEVPLSLRDQVIGQIQLANSAEWTTEQKNLVEAIVAQATLALENARLVEESQITAAQERLTNEIIAKIWASSNMDNILQTTVRELGRSLEATEVEIELSMEGENGK